MAYHLCIEVSSMSAPLAADDSETHILHVEFYGTGRDDYRVSYDKLERTLLTEYLKQADGPDFHQKLMKLAFDFSPTDKTNLFCRSVLERGIFCRQRVYFFLGHSDEQLKKKSCFMMSASHEKIHELLAQFGDFTEERNIGKRARKISMLFSALNEPLDLAEDEYEVEPETRRGVFRSQSLADGCGFMPREFSSAVQELFELKHQPSAVYVRYRGIEGMLVLKEDLPEVKLLFHSSMQKFVTPDENMPKDFSFADVVDYSCPYVNGYLDNRMVMLLAEAGVSFVHLEELQAGYYELLENMIRNTAAAEYFLRLRGEVQFLEHIHENGVDSRVKDYFKVLLMKELDKMKTAKYTRILVPKSRIVFVVRDPYGKLKQGECYFKPTIPDDDNSFATAGKIAVVHMPCYHPGDVQVIKLNQEMPGYENLRDCLVLSANDPCHGMFEGLEGNRFFVSWDTDLIPGSTEAPCDYLPTITAKLRGASAKSVSNLSAKMKKSQRSGYLKDREEMLRYFATFSDETPKIEEEYMKYATALGPSSKECRQLSKLLYQAASFTEDTATLQKKLEQIKQSGSLMDEEQDDMDEYGNLRRTLDMTATEVQCSVRLTMRRSSRSRLPGHEIWKEINMKAEAFLDRMLREIHKSVG